MFKIVLEGLYVCLPHGLLWSPVLCHLIGNMKVRYSTKWGFLFMGGAILWRLVLCHFIGSMSDQATSYHSPLSNIVLEALYVCLPRGLLWSPVLCHLIGDMKVRYTIEWGFLFMGGSILWSLVLCHLIGSMSHQATSYHSPMFKIVVEAL